MEDIRLNEESLERLGKVLIDIGEASHKMADCLANFNKVYNQYCENIKNSEVSAEMREKLDKKKSEIIDYTQTLGIVESEVLKYLTDEILAQAACYDLCPETVCQCLILDNGFKELYVNAIKQRLDESLKKAGLV